MGGSVANFERDAVMLEEGKKGKRGDTEAPGKSRGWKEISNANALMCSVA
jgi:hypothetical protein